MTKTLKTLVNLVESWPEDRQGDLLRVVELMGEYDESAFRLSEEQAEEVRRRLGEENPQVLTLEQFNTRSHKRYGV